ncbi:MAG: MGMT family protein [Thermogutta sp.]
MPDSFDITEPPDLEADLRRLIAAVPPGRVTTCGALAECLGDRSAAVWIGRWLLNHSHTEECGCHRVVRAGGMLGGYAGGEQDKIARLQSEGALLPLGDWNARALFSADELRLALPVPPLAKLRERQEAVRQAVVLRPPARPPEYLGGVDASYGPSGEAVAAYCHVRRRDGRVLERILIRRECRFN